MTNSPVSSWPFFRFGTLVSKCTPSSQEVVSRKGSKGGACNGRVCPDVPERKVSEVRAGSARRRRQTTFVASPSSQACMGQAYREVASGMRVARRTCGATLVRRSHGRPHRLRHDLEPAQDDCTGGPCGRDGPLRPQLIRLSSPERNIPCSSEPPRSTASISPLPPECWLAPWSTATRHAGQGLAGTVEAVGGGVPGSPRAERYSGRHQALPR